MFFLDIIAHKKLHQNLKKLQFETTPLVSDQTKDFYTQDTIEASSSELYQSNSQPQGIATSESLESIYQRILNCLVLEFGIVFHSVFVGLSLAIAGDEFIALYIAITFHQLLEGLGLGTRFASTTWPKGSCGFPGLSLFATALQPRLQSR